jgi:hypothetical protein
MSSLTQSSQQNGSVNALITEVLNVAAITLAGVLAVLTVAASV